MRRFFLCCVALTALAVSCPAAEQTTPISETLIRLNVSPAQAPKPALRYRLLPELKEMSPGNPILNYMKCMLEHERFFFDKEAFERRETLLAMPLKELPVQELQEYGRLALRQTDRAARLDNPDWQVLLKLKSDGINLLLPEVQQIRGLARALAVRFRSEIAVGHFDDAINTAKTMFAMSHHLGEHPTAIGDLVGIAIATITISPLEEMLAQPGCPNLYWALTTLPCPLVSLEKGMEGERLMMWWVFRDLPDRTPMKSDQLQTFIASLDRLLREAGGRPPKEGVRAWLDARSKDEKKLAAARHRLVECGIAEERLMRFPLDQVILLDEKRECDERFDELWKTTSLSIWQIEAMAAQLKSHKEPSLFADLLLPTPRAVQRARGRLEQRIALLRHVEALRLYAAEHNGTLPAKLSDVSVPLPDDPFTGKPFRYEVHGSTAHLRGSPPSGEEKTPHFNIHYEVTLQK